jgi:uncharacterized membrane protein
LAACWVAAGITLFVAAHWAELSPATRFTMVLLMVAIFHAGGSAAAERFPVFSTTLHGVGTACLGAAIYPTAQIFHLHENWVFPGWLLAQWGIATENQPYASRPMVFGVTLLAITYLSARLGDEQSYMRRTLVWVGSLALLPCLATAIISAFESESWGNYYKGPWMTQTMWAVGVAIGGPLLLAFLLRGRAACPARCRRYQLDGGD